MMGITYGSPEGTLRFMLWFFIINLPCPFWVSGSTLIEIVRIDERWRYSFSIWRSVCLDPCYNTLTCFGLACVCLFICFQIHHHSMNQLFGKIINIIRIHTRDRHNNLKLPQKSTNFPIDTAISDSSLLSSQGEVNKQVRGIIHKHCAVYFGHSDKPNPILQHLPWNGIAI